MAAAALILAAVTHGQTVIATTGNLGSNVVGGLVPYNLTLTVISVPVEGVMLNVTYGLWNSPDVPVTVKLNSVTVGSFTADNAFFSGTRTDQFNVTSLVTVGANTVNFLGSSTGDYVISQVEFITAAIPEPSTYLLLGAGLAMMFWPLRRHVSGSRGE